MNYYSEGCRVYRTLDGEETMMAQTANPFLTNYFAYQLNLMHDA